MRKRKSSLALLLAVAMVFQFCIFSSQSAWAGAVDVNTGEQVEESADQATDVVTDEESEDMTQDDAVLAEDAEGTDSEEPAVSDAEEDSEEAVEPEAEAEETTVTEESPAEEAPAAAPMTSKVFRGKAGGVNVIVSAPEGAFAEGTSMVVSEAPEEDVIEAAQDLVDGDISMVKAVDITFFDKDGNEVQPQKEVSVALQSEALNAKADQEVIHIDGDNAEKIEDVNFNGKNATFAADHFSIYAIVEEGVVSEDARLTVKFVQAGGAEEDLMITKRQKDEGHLNQYVYDPGAGEFDAKKQLFKGWTTDPNYTTKTSPMTIQDVRSEVTKALDAGAAEGDTLTFYAMVFDFYHVTYLDEHGVTVKTDQALFRSTDTTSSREYTVNLPYTPYAVEEGEGEGQSAEFMGWQQLQPEVSGKEVIFANEDTFKLDEMGSEVILKAKVVKGYWLSFNENMSNATYTQPQFIANGNPEKPADPTRAGYTFDGWYTEDASSARDGQVAGEVFDFNKPLTATTMAHAKWTKNKKADYNVVIWKQSVDGKSYDFDQSISVKDGDVDKVIESVTAEGSGNGRYAVIDGTDYVFTGFHLSTEKGTDNSGYDQNVKLAAEGNTVINVYYDRNEYTLTFMSEKDYTYVPTTSTEDGTYYIRNYGSYQEYQLRYRNGRWQYYRASMWGGGSWENLPNGTTVYERKLDEGSIIKTITGLYGESIKSNFPIVGTNGTTYTGYVWEPQDSQIFTTGDVPSLVVMPAENSVFVAKRYGTGTMVHMYYYTEDLSGSGYDEFQHVQISANGGINSTKSEDFNDLEGFTQESSDPAYGADGTVSLNRNNNYTIKFYYTRNTYDIVFRDGVYTDPTGAVIDETKMKDSDFESATGIKYEASIKDKGNYKPTRDGYVFLGWYTDDTCSEEGKFDFNTTMPAHNVTLYAKWVSSEFAVNLHPNDSTDDPIQYTNDKQPATFYADYGEKIGNVGGERIYNDLVGWYTDAAMKHPYDFDVFVLNNQVVDKYGKLYDETDIDPEYPSTIGEMNLYAKWRSKLIGADGIDVVYDAGEKGTNAPEDTHNYTDKAEAIAGAAADSTDEEFVFSNWVVQKWNGTAFEDTSVKVFPGDTFTVIADDAKITEASAEDWEAAPALDKTKLAKDGSYKYTVKLRAEYVEKDRGVKTHIKWYYNYADAGIYADSGEELAINEMVEIPAAPTRVGYEFKGWIRAEEKGLTTDETALYLTYEDGTYMHDGKEAIGVAADEVKVGNSAYHGMYAKWEAKDVKYTVEFYYQNADGEYEIDESLTDDTRTAKTDSTVKATSEDKAQTKNDKYVLSNTDEAVLSATVKGDGTTVLKVYFDLNKVDVTVEHYLLGEETAFETKTVPDQVVGSTFTAEPKTTYKEKNLTVNSYDPRQPMTVKTSGNVVKIYYTLPLTITAKTDSKAYDGKPLDGAYTIEGNLDVTGELLKIQTALGTAPSITNVSESPKAYLTKEDQAKITGIPAYYKVTYTPGTLTITPAGGNDVEPEPGDDSETMDAEAKSIKVVYDGKAHTVSGKATKDGSTIEYKYGDSDWTTEAPSLTNVGKTTFSIRATNPNYETVEKEGYTLEVTPREITVDDSTSKVYNGEDQVFTIEASKAKGVVEGETLTLTGATITGKNVGEHTAVAKYTWSVAKADDSDSTGNYTIKVTGKLTITKAGDNDVEPEPGDDAETMDAAAKSIKVVYDGKAHTVSGKATKDGSTIEYKYGDSDWTTEAPSLTNVGKTTFSIRATNPNYETVEKEGYTLEVTPREITVDDSTSKVYNGEDQVFTIEASKAKGVVEGETLTLTGATITGKNVGEYTDVAEYTWSVAKADDSDSTGNYTIKVTGKLTITAVAEEVVVNIKEHSDEVEYNGEEQKVEGYDVTKISNELYTKDDFKFNGEAIAKGTDAGTYDMEVKAEDFENLNKNFASVKFVVEDGQLVITPVKEEVVVNIKEHSDEVEYNGEEQKVEGYDVTKISNKLYKEENFKFNGEAIAKGTDAGSYDMEVKAEDFENTSKNFASVKFVVEDGQLVITPVKEEVVVNIKEHSDEVEYNGEEQKVEGYDVTKISNELYKESNFKFNGEAIAKGTDAGSYDMEVKAEDFENTSKNFASVKFVVEDGQLVITPVKEEVVVNIKEHSGEERYDGSEKKVEGYDVTKISNELYKESNFKFNGEAIAKGTDAGTYDMEVKPEDFENLSKNFASVKFEVEDGQLVITKAPIIDPENPEDPDDPDAKRFEVTGPEDKMYDGDDTPQPVTITDTKTGDDLVEGTDCTIEYTDDTKNVGEVTVTIEGKGNYTGGFTRTYNITPRPITFTSADKSKVYDGKALEGDVEDIKVGGEGFAPGEFVNYEMTGSQTNVGESPNSFEIIWAEEAEEDIDTAADETADKAPTALASNYDWSKKEGTLKVTPAELTITTGSAEKEYDGKPLTNSEASIDGLMNDEVVTITATGSQTEVGTSENTYELDWGDVDPANYTIVKENLGKLTVTAKAPAPKKEDAPKTGDPASMTLPIMIMVASLILLALLVTLARRRRTN